MSYVVYGFVTKISEKSTANGGTVYNLCVESEGVEDWYGYGFDVPDFYEGAEIEFEAEDNGQFTNVVKGSVEVIDPGEAPAPRRGSGRRPGNSGGGQRPARGGGGRASGGRSAGGRSGGRGGPGGARGGSSRPSGRASAGSGGKSGGKAEVDWDRKDKYIRLQSCQNTAIAMVAMLVQAGAVALPKEKAKQYDAIAALVEEEAARLFAKYDAIADGTYDTGAEQEEEQYDDDIPE